jgi:hypothetical protein
MKDAWDRPKAKAALKLIDEAQGVKLRLKK